MNKQKIKLFLFLIIFLSFDLISYSKSPKSNIMLIIIDAVRYDHLSYGGYKEKTTPFLDSLAARGTIFPFAFSSGNATVHTLSSLFTGLPVDLAKTDYQDGSIPACFQTLTEVFKKNGYICALFPYFGNAGYYSLAFGFTRGFDYIESDATPNRSDPSLFDPFKTDPLFCERADRHILDKALSWLNDKMATENKPFFVIIHLAAGHDPYEKSEPVCYKYISKEDVNLAKKIVKEEIGEEVTTNISAAFGTPLLSKFPEIKKYVISQYEASLFSTDQMLAGFFKKFKNQKNTIFVITADHGEGLAEHKESYQHGENNPPYSENFRVPLIFYGKEIPDGVIKKEIPFSSIDLMPTLLGLAGIKIPSQVFGKNYSTEVKKKSTGQKKFFKSNIFMETLLNFKVWGIFQEGWKYFTTLNSLDWIHNYSYSFSPEGLFNIVTDPEEKENNIFLYLDIARRLRSELETNLLWKRIGWNVIIQGKDHSINDYKVRIETKGLKIDPIKTDDSNFTLHYFSENNPIDISTALFLSSIPQKKEELECLNFKDSFHYAEIEFYETLQFNQSYLMGCWVYAAENALIKLVLKNEKEEIISSMEFLPVSSESWVLAWNRFFTCDNGLGEKIKAKKRYKMVFLSSKKGTKIKNAFFSPSTDWIRNMSIIDNNILELDFKMSEGVMVLNFRTRDLNDLPRFSFKINGKIIPEKRIYKGQNLYNKRSNEVEDYIYYDLHRNMKLKRNGFEKVYIYNIIDSFLGRTKGKTKANLSKKDIETLRSLGYIKREK